MSYYELVEIDVVIFKVCLGVGFCCFLFVFSWWMNNSKMVLEKWCCGVEMGIVRLMLLLLGYGREVVVCG